MLKSYLQTINSVSEFLFMSLLIMRKTHSVLSPTRDSISTLSFISLYFCCLRPKSVFSKTRLYVWVILYICLVTEKNWFSDIYNWDSLSLSYPLYPLVASLHALFIATIFMFCTTGIELVSKDLGKTYATKSWIKPASLTTF